MYDIIKEVFKFNLRKTLKIYNNITKELFN